ncbi:MAG: Thiol-disulfide oxidoreductase ResA [Bacteroidota bacterium]
MKRILTFSFICIVLASAISVASYRNFTPMAAMPINGEKAPNLIYKNPEDKVMALSELKGKMVLIDFWASWCGPCRATNPYIVQIYNKYHDKKFKNGKGFEVFSVSLDNNKEKWVAAIKQDGLIWPYHVSDLGGWNSAGARQYGVNSIPRAFLIDGEGTIIGAGLHPDEIIKELDARLK